MPSVMDAARNIVPEFKDGIVGAGIYYHEVQAREDGSNIDFTSAIGRLNTLLYQAIHIVADPDEIAYDLERLGFFFEDTLQIDSIEITAKAMEGTFARAIDDYVDHLDRHSLFEAEATAAVAARKVLDGLDGKPGFDVSGSHCIRLDVPSDEAVRLMRRFEAGRLRSQAA